MVSGLNGGISELQQLLLHGVDSFSVHSLGRKLWAPIASFDTQYDVAAAEIVKIVGESADRVQHALRIPTCLVLYPLAFNCTLAKQMINVDW